MSAGEVRTWQDYHMDQRMWQRDRSREAGAGTGPGMDGQRTDARKRASPVHTGTELSGGKSQRSGAVHTGTSGAEPCTPAQD